MPAPLNQAKAEFFWMLGHPVRIRVLELIQDGPKPVRDLLAEIDIEPSSVSQQLAILRRSDIVTATRHGTTVVDALAGGDVAELIRAAPDPHRDARPGRTSCWPSSGNRLPSRPDAEPITASPRQVKPPVWRQQAGPQSTVPSQLSQGYGP
jgi:ArsR family transcriptional regulator, arsenate/arsenite/antimonite-responsive transcriptional repressor